MYRRPSGNINRRKRSFSGITAVAMVVLAAAVALWIASSARAPSNPAPSAPRATYKESAVIAKPQSAPPASPQPTFTNLPTQTAASQSTATPQAIHPNGFNGPLAAKSALLLDGGGNTLYALEDETRRYPASTTKMLTALVALQHGNLNDKIKVGHEVSLPPKGSSLAGLQYGETLSFQQLLNAMLIPSGNDAAYAIAVYIGRKASNDPKMDYRDAVNVFVDMMNDRAQALGAVHSHFANPDGFQDENHYTTAADLALIARQAMLSNEFRKIVSTEKYKLPDIKVKDKDGNPKTRTRLLTNTNELLNKSQPCYLQACTGIKTGHTDDAGHCLVASATQGGKTVLCVVMDSTEDGVFEDARALLLWGLADSVH